LLVNANTPSPTATTATPTSTKPASRTGRIPCMLTAGRSRVGAPSGCASVPRAGGEDV
jgi:hypothetical protein